MRIGIIGLGFVGLTIAVAFAYKGYNVVGVDIDAEKIEQINEGNIPFYEKELGDILKKVIGRSFHVYSNYNALAHIDIVFICVGTPTTPEGTQDQRYIYSTVKSLATVWRGTQRFKTIIVKSTVLPGTTRRLADLFGRLSGLVNGVDYGFVANPEFLSEGTAFKNILYPDRLVIGCIEKRSCRIVEDLWREFYKKIGRIPPIIVMSSEEAELVKYASNTYLAMRISYANTIANICEKIDNCDVLKVLNAVGLDQRIGKKYLKPGLGYGGSCLPKDVKAIIRFMEELGVKPTLFKAVDAVNERQYLKAIEYLYREYNTLEGKSIAVLGVAFKPDTDDIRGSIAVKIIDLLLKHGAKIKVHDPRALHNLKKIFGNLVEYKDNPIKAIEGTDAVIIATEWSEYLKLEPAVFKKYMRNPVVIDGRRIYDPELFVSRGIKFYAIGYSR